MTNDLPVVIRHFGHLKKIYHAHVGVLRPDHVPTLDEEPNDRPGYAILGRLFAVGYIRGIQEGVYHDDLAAFAASKQAVDR